MSVYFIAQIAIRDQEEYGKYLTACDRVFEQFNGEYLAVDQAPTDVGRPLGLRPAGDHPLSVRRRFAEMVFLARIPGDPQVPPGRRPLRFAAGQGKIRKLKVHHILFHTAVGIEQGGVDHASVNQ